MHILLIEDNIEKSKDIQNYLEETVGSYDCNITLSDNLVDANRKIHSSSFDLIIFDMYLPFHQGSTETQDISTVIIDEYSQSQLNYQAETILITTYNSPENNSLFNQRGVSVVNFGDDEKWKDALKVKILRAKDKKRFNFIIFCALVKERFAYNQTEAELGEVITFNGMDCQLIEIEGIKGLCIIPTDMGLVNMAITATKAIELFQPKYAVMSGICAGVPENVNMLDLIVGKLCWEYQTGKYKDNEFRIEPYQNQINNKLKTELKQFMSNQSNIDKIKSDLNRTELEDFSIHCKPISSGSAVIQSESKLKEIGIQHRDMFGLEMEMYAFYEAALQSQCEPLFFGVKSVADFGDEKKDDNVQAIASTLSARFVVNFLSTKFT